MINNIDSRLIKTMQIKSLLLNIDAGMHEKLLV